jgi:hypothetical protein
VSSTAELRRRVAALDRHAALPPDAAGADDGPSSDLSADVQHYAAGTTNVRMLFLKVNVSHVTQ